MTGDDLTDRPPPVRRSLLLVVPVLAFAALAAVLFLRLRSGADPAALPSAMIGKPVPSFSLPAVPGSRSGRPGAGLSSADLKGQITVINVFASWCAPCQVEHPMLMRLAREPGIRLVGIDYKEPNPAAGQRFLPGTGCRSAPSGRCRRARGRSISASTGSLRPSWSGRTG